MNKEEKVINLYGIPVHATTEWPDYDPDMSYDGGSYYQPSITATWTADGAACVLHIEDSSCGDFGGDIAVSLTVGGKASAYARYGSLAEGHGADCTTFRGDIPDHQFALLVAAELGYCRVPYNGTWREVQK